MKLYKAYLEANIADEIKIKKFIRVAGAVIMKEDEESGEKKILLIQRAADDHFPLMYEIPRGKCDGGDSGDKNEKLIDCLKRETKEECGLDIEPVQFIDEFSYIADNGTRKSTQYNFLCEMKNPNQEVKLSFEHDSFLWVTSVGQVEMMVMPEIKKTISKIFNTDKEIVSYPYNPEEEDTIEEYLKVIQ